MKEVDFVFLTILSNYINLEEMIEKGLSMNKPQYSKLIEKEYEKIKQLKYPHTPKIYTERIKKMERNPSCHDLNKADVYSIPYKLWKNRKSCVDTPESRDSMKSRRGVKPLILNSGRVVISQTAKELSKNNIRLEEKNKEV